MNKLSYLFSALVVSTQLFGSSINLEIQYEQAADGQKVHQSKTIDFPDSFTNEPGVSHAGMHKTLFAIKVSNLITSSLKEYHEARTSYLNSYPIYTPYAEVSEPQIARPAPPRFPRYWEQIRQEYALKLLHSIQKLEATAEGFCTDDDVTEAIHIVKKLSDAMMQGEVGPVFERESVVPYSGMPLASCNMKAGAPAALLNVTAGGVQDYAHFKKQVLDGFVPPLEAFIEEGFLSEFNLQLESAPCEQLIGLNPAWAYDKETNKLFVQVGMSSNVTPESFVRPPVNLSFVIDISGSMGATDNTERSRLEWAKDAVAKAISHLNEQDIVSIVLFDSVSVVLLEPTFVTDKALLLNKLQKIQTGNSTNLDAGLRDGFMLASKAYKAGYENRVLLFSDAGLNTGMTDPTSILRLVSDYASENIGLTAIGVGENFHHDFIHKITMSKGGNALFVHTGAGLTKFFNSFDYLVTPVAHHLKVSSSFQDLKAKLVKTYGVPMLKNEPIQELINVRTLFFSEGGGAIVLEYDL